MQFSLLENLLNPFRVLPNALVILFMFNPFGIGATHSHSPTVSDFPYPPKADEFERGGWFCNVDQP